MKTNEIENEVVAVETGNGFSAEVEITPSFRAKCEKAGISIEQGAREYVEAAQQRRHDKANRGFFSLAEREAYNNR